MKLSGSCLCGKFYFSFFSHVILFWSIKRVLCRLTAGPGKAGLPQCIDLSLVRVDAKRPIFTGITALYQWRVTRSESSETPRNKEWAHRRQEPLRERSRAVLPHE